VVSPNPTDCSREAPMRVYVEPIRPGFQVLEVSTSRAPFTMTNRSLLWHGHWLCVTCKMTRPLHELGTHDAQGELYPDPWARNVVWTPKGGWFERGGVTDEGDLHL
jgi:hypothetical protein